MLRLIALFKKIGTALQIPFTTDHPKVECEGVEFAEEGFEILRSKYHIVAITFNNYGTLADQLSIDIHIRSEEFGDKVLHFTNINSLPIEAKAYNTSLYSSIVIRDVSEWQWCDVRYKVSVANGAMTFYCKCIEIESV